MELKKVLAGHFADHQMRHIMELGVGKQIGMLICPRQGWGQLFEMHTIAVVRSCKAKVCSCNLSCSCGCGKPPFEVVLSVVAGLNSQFVLAVVDDLRAAVAVVHEVVPG